MRWQAAGDARGGSGGSGWWGEYLAFYREILKEEGI